MRWLKEAGVKEMVQQVILSDDNEVDDGDGSYVLAIQREFLT
jgi:hypothetical protein